MLIEGSLTMRRTRHPLERHWLACCSSLALVAACAASPQAGGGNGAQGGNGGAGAGSNPSGASGPGPSGTGGDFTLIDAGASDSDVSNDCSDADKLVYVVSDENKLYSFAPNLLKFTEIGTINCPTA